MSSRPLFPSAGLAAKGIALLLALTGPAQGALDLQGMTQEYVSSGIVYKRLLFQDAAQAVEMELPEGWTYRAESATRCQLIPPGQGFAHALLQAEPSIPSAAAGESMAKACESEALAALPADSQAITVLQTIPESDVAGGAGYEVVLSYKRLGYTFLRSCRFVQRGDQRLLFQLSAPESEFAILSRSFRRAVQSLTWK